MKWEKERKKEKLFELKSDTFHRADHPLVDFYHRRCYKLYTLSKIILNVYFKTCEYIF